MSILSFEFLCFLAAVFLAYYAVPLRLRPWVLLIASAVFAALAGWQTAAHITCVSMITWGGALELAALRGRPRTGRLLLALLLTADLGTMCFLKYYPSLMGLNWILPLGMSYFTFQSAGYMIDVFRGKAKAEKNPLRTLLFVGYFLQLPQGPISSWQELAGQLSVGHRLEPMNAVSGFTLMAWGYFKKLVIADRLAVTTQALLTSESLPGWFVLGGVILYTIRLYADFSGGMDIVRGYSCMLGITLPENFRRPFFSVSVAEYWRRWHISLGAWFRKYVLYPMSLSRDGAALSKFAGRFLGKKTARSLPSALATLTVFLLIGIWHMASWNAVVFGAYWGVLMAASILLEPCFKRMSTALHLPRKGWMTPLRWLRTMLLVLLSQFFAFTPGPQAGWALLRAAFSDWELTGFAERWLTVMPTLEWVIVGAAIAILLLADALTERRGDLHVRLAKRSILIRWPVLLLIIIATLVFGCYGSGVDSSAFVYTQF